MKRAKHLLEKIAEPENLRHAFLLAAKGKQAKGEVLRFRSRLDLELGRLRSGILDGNVAIGQFYSFTIHDPKKRTIHAAAFAERVLHHAILIQCEAIFERHAVFDSYACRRGKGREAAVQRLFGNTHAR